MMTEVMMRTMKPKSDDHKRTFLALDAKGGEFVKKSDYLGEIVWKSLPKGENLFGRRRKIKRGVIGFRGRSKEKT